jgi:hypothetical protein
MPERRASIHDNAADDANKGERLQSGLPSTREVELCERLLGETNLLFVGWVTQSKDGKEQPRLLALTRSFIVTVKKKDALLKGNSSIIICKKLHLFSLRRIVSTAQLPNVATLQFQSMDLSFLSARTADICAAVHRAVHRIAQQFPPEEQVELSVPPSHSAEGRPSPDGIVGLVQLSPVEAFVACYEGMCDLYGALLHPAVVQCLRKAISTQVGVPRWRRLQSRPRMLFASCSTLFAPPPVRQSPSRQLCRVFAFARLRTRVPVVNAPLTGVCQPLRLRAPRRLYYARSVARACSREARSSAAPAASSA